MDDEVPEFPDVLLPTALRLEGAQTSREAHNARDSTGFQAPSGDR